ncbi:hypothetical protein [Cellulomonas cellasea]|uniref:Uncharacterized protein n=1 Tax=Cellulomonas cellasea TaxID=43670 RepID=A0A7W4UKB9_9CELL|nr:hypothetical protein [Cellulomonas cellasea]MBB2925474.1 hypothetical protein [Cellulomonas cellasea]
MELRYALTGVGWAEARLTHDDQEAVVTASYLGDALEDLLDGVDALLRGAPDVRVVWCEEPGEHVWTLSRSGADVHVRVAWVPGPDPGGETVVDLTAPLDHVARAVADGAQSALDRYGEVEYWDRWAESPFPLERLRRLQHRLGTGPAPAPSPHARDAAPTGEAFAALARALDVELDAEEPSWRSRAYGWARSRPDLEPALLAAVAEEPDLRVAVSAAMRTLERIPAERAAAWVDAVPEGGQRRVRERARDVAVLRRCTPADAVVTPEEVATWSDWVQRELVRRSAAPEVLRRLEAHTRIRYVRADARARLGGPGTAAPRAHEYEDSPLLLRQAAALVLVTRWLAEVRLDDADVDGLVDHLGNQLAHGPGATIPAGAPGHDALAAALGGELPARLRSRATRRSVDPDVLHATLTDLVEVTYGSHFSAVDHAGSQRHLCALEDRLAPWDVVLPPRTDLEDQASGAGLRDGAPPSPEQVALWRTLAERPRRLAD